MTKKEQATLTYKGIAFNSIAEIIGGIYEYSGDTKDQENMRLATLGEVYGVINHTQRLLEEVLEVDYE